MDEWGWEQLRPWLDARVELPVGPLFCIIDGPTRRRPWSGAGVRSEFRRLAVRAGVRRRFAPHQLRHAHAVELAREGVALNIIQRQLGHANLGTTSIYLQGIDRSRGDHHRCACAPRADDVRQRRAAALNESDEQDGAGAPRSLPLRPGEASALTVRLTRPSLVHCGSEREAGSDACSLAEARGRDVRRHPWTGTPADAVAQQLGDGVVLLGGEPAGQRRRHRVVGGG
jgi:integrase/recombinase XerD